MKNRTATTVKIDKDLYEKFKILGIRYRLTLQDLVEKCIFRYVTEESFRDENNNYSIPQETNNVSLEIENNTSLSQDLIIPMEDLKCNEESGSVFQS